MNKEQKECFESCKENFNQVIADLIEIAGNIVAKEHCIAGEKLVDYLDKSSSFLKEQGITFSDKIWNNFYLSVLPREMDYVIENFIYDIGKDEVDDCCDFILSHQDEFLNYAQKEGLFSDGVTETLFKKEYKNILKLYK